MHLELSIALLSVGHFVVDSVCDSSEWLMLQIWLGKCFSDKSWTLRIKKKYNSSRFPPTQFYLGVVQKLHYFFFPLNEQRNLGEWEHAVLFSQIVVRWYIGGGIDHVWDKCWCNALQMQYFSCGLFCQGWILLLTRTHAPAKQKKIPSQFSYNALWFQFACLQTSKNLFLSTVLKCNFDIIR